MHGKILPNGFGDEDMGLYSRNRGKRGERLWCSFCREQGYDVHRTAQYRGNTGAAGDVEGLPRIHCEVKFVQKLNIREAMNQSIEDSYAASVNRKVKRIERLKNLPGEYFLDSSLGNNDVEIPIVASKRNRDGWLVTMMFFDWCGLVRAFGGMDFVQLIRKTQKRFSVRKVLLEACVKASTKRPIALMYYRGNLQLVTMRAEDWFTLYREWEAGMDLKARKAHERHE